MPIGFKAVKPDIYDVEAFTRASKKAVDKVAKGMLDDFEKTTRTWEHKPVFGTSVFSSGDKHSAVIGTNDKIYKFVDQGTKPHTIKAKRRGGRLAYNKGGFRAKTSPRRLSSGAGARANGPLRRPKAVRHPGTKAREFSDEISKRWRNPSVRLLQDAFSDVVKGFVRR